MKAGTFGAYPLHSTDPYVIRQAKRSQAEPVFRPASGPKSTPVKSIITVNTNRCTSDTHLCFFFIHLSNFNWQFSAVVVIGCQYIGIFDQLIGWFFFSTEKIKSRTIWLFYSQKNKQSKKQHAECSLATSLLGRSGSRCKETYTGV